MEKEQAKRAREELREQQKLEQEIRAAREKIAKERKHLTTTIRDLQARLDKVESEEERAALLEMLAEVEAGRAELESEEKLIDYREQNAKAGYVYVISNLGAFWEGVYKIGMSGRLEPMDRVDELGDASVPFWFDVHAMVFSNNAPALEAKLHERFAEGRLNKVNGRKEFFRADITQIESVIRQNYHAVVEVTHEAAAEQYRESLRMPSQLYSHRNGWQHRVKSAGRARLLSGGGFLRSQQNELIGTKFLNNSDHTNRSDSYLTCRHKQSLATEIQKGPRRALLYSNQNHLVSHDSTFGQPCSAFHSFKVL